ncbi:MAG: sigma-54-dependent Fis family transcriptional regulator [Candidatus Aminicenantes bacterium]|nr:sigma-54-dependent Fis family transcriptional regulator [Candidatus Aminicenantes bacterium]
MPPSTTKQPLVLLVDDEDPILISYSFLLKSAGIQHIATLSDPRRVLPFLQEHDVAVVVLDIDMPYMSGRELLERIREELPSIPVIMATATNEVDTAVECLLLGAKDYLVKPVEKSRLISSVQRLLEVRHLENEVTALKESLLSRELTHPSAFSNFITVSPEMHSLFKYIEAIADSPFPVLILGETGVGKELIARAIHLCGSNTNELVVVNVSGLDDTLFTDTLFGHTRGAFTGASTSREGLINRAEGGTLFLDEIGDLGIPSQVKLLRLIQEKEYYPLGSDIPHRTDCRIVAATNRDIRTLVDNDKFRKDLYYRFLAHQIHVPPLRERKEDIPALFSHFVQEAARDLKKKIPSHPPELITLLKAHAFPGNVRELQALVYDAMSRYESGVLSMASFRTLIEKEGGMGQIEVPEEDLRDRMTSLDGFPTLKQAETYLILRALDQAGGNQGVAASLLGISRQALNKRLQRDKNLKPPDN